MLTVQGLGRSGCIFGDCGLGVYTKGTEFTCFKDGSIYACKARGANLSATLAAFKALQSIVRTISAQMSAAGVLQVPSQLSTLAIDGQPGNTTALGVQFIGAAFMPAVPPVDPGVAAALTPTGNAQVDIEAIAAEAVEITAYFNDVLLNHPEALKPAPQTVEKVVEVTKVIEKQWATRFRPIGALVIGTGLAVAVGLAVASVYYATRDQGGAEDTHGEF